MFEQAELQGTQMGPNDPPNAKGTAKIAPEIANSKKKIGPFGSFWPFWPKRSFWSFWPAISETGWPRRKKVPLGVLLRSARRSCNRVCFLSKFRGGKLQNLGWGCVKKRVKNAVRTRWRGSE